MPVRKSVTVLLVGTLLACARNQSPEVSLSSGAVPAVEIISLSPTPGSEVGPETTIEAELRYTVPDIESHPGPYSVQLFFRGPGGNGSRPATPEERAVNGPIVEELTQPEGIATVRYPLASLLGRARVAEPLMVDFTLSDRSGLSPEFLRAEAAGRRASPVQTIAQVTVQFVLVDSIG